jgi:regulator of sigma E protease
MGIKKFKMTWSAPITATVNTLQFTGETFRGLGDLVANVFSGITSQFSSNEAVKNAGKQKIEAAGDAVAGPVGIIGVLFPQVAESGLAEVLLLAAIISISLACMNVLPIPALDGGRWLLIIIFEKILRRKLTPETENKIVSRAFVTLLILAALITVLDVIKIIR